MVSRSILLGVLYTNQACARNTKIKIPRLLLGLFCRQRSTRKTAYRIGRLSLGRIVRKILNHAAFPAIFKRLPGQHGFRSEENSFHLFQGLIEVEISLHRLVVP